LGGWKSAAGWAGEKSYRGHPLRSGSEISKLGGSIR
jgi:hypothetical protein